MIMNKLLIILLFSLSLAAQAKVKVIAHYNFGKSGNVTYTAVPKDFTDEVSKVKITAKGNPVFFADAPGDKLLNGEGAILFNGKDDGFVCQEAFEAPGDNMLFEVWVKARSLDGHKTRVIAANGSGSKGYMIGQVGKQWVLVSGSVAVVPFGDVIKDQWVHFAALYDKGATELAGDVTLWMNGKKVASVGKTSNFAPCFSIGSNAEGSDNFHGDIYEVRYSTFENDQFDPDSDFLLDYKKIKAVNSKIASERKELIKNIESSGLGKELISTLPQTTQSKDWLINTIETPCKLFVEKSKDGLTSMFQLNNGLVSRTFYVSDNIACVSYKNLSNDAEYIRAVKPEVRFMLDSTWYEVGGLKGQPENSYLLDSWYSQLTSNPQAFVLEKIETSMPIERYPWKQKYNAVAADWPVKGLRVTMTYKATEAMTTLKDLEVNVSYEIYQGIPVMMKSFTITNKGNERPVLYKMECEVLAVNQDQIKRIHVESDYSFGLVNYDLQGSALLHFAGTPKNYQVGSSTTKWEVDPEYNTWATQNPAEDILMQFQHRCLLLSTLPMGPSVILKNKEIFDSFKTFELLQDSDDKERRSLGQRRMYKKIAPQVTESFIAGSITSHDEKEIKNFVDQMSELGLQCLGIDPWPGIDHDNLDETYVNHWKTISDYAKKRGIIMDGYELLIASRGRGASVDCIDPETGKQGSLFGQSVCIASDWSDEYFKKSWEFYDRTGFMNYGGDGPYHGDVCATDLHKYHRGLEDSQWEQWKIMNKQLHEAQRRGMYLSFPDWYFLNGSNTIGMGYREASSNLSPQQQLLLGRQYIYDGTYFKTPPMGYIGLQLVGFYTNDPRVGLEPLNENIKRYEQALIQYLGSGAHFTIRGKRLYDTPETKIMVSKWVNWFKNYQDILTSEIIHVSRPTGRDLDYMMHVNPFIKHKGMIIVFNPTDRAIEKQIKLPLYYTGLKKKATVMDENNQTTSFSLNEKSELMLPVKLKAQGTAWFVIE
jgi:hypothetical protein